MEAPPSTISAEPMVKLGVPDVREEGGTAQSRPANLTF